MLQSAVICKFCELGIDYGYIPFDRAFLYFHKQPKKYFLLLRFGLTKKLTKRLFLYFSTGFFHFFFIFKPFCHISRAQIQKRTPPSCFRPYTENFSEKKFRFHFLFYFFLVNYFRFDLWYWMCN